MRAGRFTLIEYMAALAMLLIVGTFALRIMFATEIRAWERSLEPGKYFVTVPAYLLLLYLYWRRSAKEAKELGQPTVRPWVWATAAFGVALACMGILVA